MAAPGEPIAAGGKSVKATPVGCRGPASGATPFQTAPTCDNSRALGLPVGGLEQGFGAGTIARTSSWWRTRPHNGICWSIISPSRISG